MVFLTRKEAMVHYDNRSWARIGRSRHHSWDLLNVFPPCTGIIQIFLQLWNRIGIFISFHCWDFSLCFRVETSKRRFSIYSWNFYVCIVSHFCKYVQWNVANLLPETNEIFTYCFLFFKLKKNMYSEMLLIFPLSSVICQWFLKHFAYCFSFLAFFT